MKIWLNIKIESWKYAVLQWGPNLWDADERFDCSHFLERNFCLLDILQQRSTRVNDDGDHGDNDVKDDCNDHGDGDHGDVDHGDGDGY